MNRDRAARLQRFYDAEFKSVDLELDGMLFLATREAAEALELAKEVFGVDHWRVRGADLRFRNLERLSRLPPEDYARAVKIGFLMRTIAQGQDRGDYKEATCAGERALELSRQIGGESTIGHAQLLLIMVDVCPLEADSNGSLRYSRSAASLCQKLLGEQHPDTVTANTRLGDALARSPQFFEAEPPLRGAYELGQRLYNAEPDDALVLEIYVLCCRNLASFCRMARDFEEARRILRQAQDAIQPGSPMYQRKLAVLLGGLSRVELAEGKSRDAVTTARRGVEAAKIAFGERHGQYPFFLLNLAEASIAAGEPREAESLIAEAERRGISGGSAHRIVRAKLLAKLGQSEEAAGLYAGVLSEMKSECGTEHPSLIRFLREFAEVKRALSLPAEALELEQQARQIETKLEDYKRTRPGPHGTK